MSSRRLVSFMTSHENDGSGKPPWSFAVVRLLCLFLRSFASPTRRTNERRNEYDEPLIRDVIVRLSCWTTTTTIIAFNVCCFCYPCSSLRLSSALWGKTIVWLGGYVDQQRHRREKKRQRRKRRTTHCRIRMYLRIVHSYGTTLRAYQ